MLLHIYSCQYIIFLFFFFNAASWAIPTSVWSNQRVVCARGRGIKRPITEWCAALFWTIAHKCIRKTVSAFIFWTMNLSFIFIYSQQWQWDDHCDIRVGRKSKQQGGIYRSGNPGRLLHNRVIICRQDVQWNQLCTLGEDTCISGIFLACIPSNLFCFFFAWAT